MSIGEVLSQLRADFPDVSISKLRFLEAEGLVEPQRTPSGYRKYGWADVARLRFVLTAQRDHYLPLRVIRDQLAALDRGDAAADVVLAVREGTGERSSAEHAVPGQVTGLAQRRPTLLPVDGTRAEPTEVRLTRAALMERSGLSDSVLTELEQLGLVRLSGLHYDSDALVVARVVAQLSEYGLEPRHLRGYRASADREVGLFTQLVAPVARGSTPAARTRAAEVVRELTALSEQLHAALVRIGLRETLGR
jgi:DNA-binding transcriptional MerR regulator